MTLAWLEHQHEGLLATTAKAFRLHRGISLMQIG